MSPSYLATRTERISDPRVTHEAAIVNDCTYHYLLGLPIGGEFKATVFLIHGWPDLSMVWRNQIPLLLDLGCRVVCPDLIGFGGTDAPEVPPNSISLYGWKRAADDIVTLAKQLGAPNIIIGGHDVGGMIVWRTALYHPEFITHVFSVCTPYAAPSKKYISTEDLVKGPLPQFGYQLHLASGEVEKQVKTKAEIRQFLSGMYLGRGAKRENLFSPTKGILLENLMKIGKSPLMSDEEMDYYVEQYSRNGLHSTLNWYRAREANHNDELALKTKEITVPCLYIDATKDVVFTPQMKAPMPHFIPKLTQREVEASHWVLVEKPNEVNKVLKDWFEGVVFGTRSKL